MKMVAVGWYEAIRNWVKMVSVIAGMPPSLYKYLWLLLRRGVVNLSDMSIDHKSLKRLLGTIEEVLNEFYDSPELHGLIDKMNALQCKMASFRDWEKPGRYDRDLWKKSMFEFNQTVDVEVSLLIDSLLATDRYRCYPVLILSTFKDASPTQHGQVASNYQYIIKGYASDRVKKSTTYRLTFGETHFLEKPDFPPGKCIPRPNKSWDE